MVLLKDFSDAGFTFFTNYQSKKGKELEANPQASICFYWDVMSRQIRIEGKVSKIEREKSVEYFSKRPLNSRVSAFISEQSKVIKDRQVLIDSQKEAVRKYQDDNSVPCPEEWVSFIFLLLFRI